MANVPDFNQWLDSVWGWPSENFGATSFFASASGVVWGANPPYTALDFGQLYPKFQGAPSSLVATSDGSTAVLLGVSGANAAALAPGQLIAAPFIPAGTSILGVSQTTLTPTGTLTLGSISILGVSSTEGCYIGQPIAGPGISAGATLTAVGYSTLQMSAPATVAGVAVALAVTALSLTLSQNTTAATTGNVSVYAAPLIPLLVLNVYIRLASASLVFNRWQDSWFVGMGLYVAHFATLWLRSEAGVAAALDPAAAGLAKGILTSKSADGVSAGYENLSGEEIWGAWNLTSYGQLLIPMFKAQGAGFLFLH